MNRIGKGLGSLILLAVLLVGIPAGLVFFAGNPLPSWDELVAGFTMRDYTGSFLIGTIMPIVAWIAWATFAVGFLAELPAQLRGQKVRGQGRGSLNLPPDRASAASSRSRSVNSSSS